MTSAVLGALATLKLSDDASPEVYTLIAEVLRISEVGSVAPEVDVTNFDSTSKEYIGGLPDGATVDFDMNWIKGTQQVTLQGSVGNTHGFQLTWPDSPATVATFYLVVLGFNIAETTPEAQITASITGRITGDIAWS